MKVVSLQLALCAKEHLPEHARKPGQLHLDRITRTDQVRDPAVFAACSGAGKGSRHVPSAATEAKFVSGLCCVFPRVRRRCGVIQQTLCAATVHQTHHHLPLCQFGKRLAH